MFNCKNILFIIIINFNVQLPLIDEHLFPVVVRLAKIVNFLGSVQNKLILYNSGFNVGYIYNK